MKTLITLSVTIKHKYTHKSLRLKTLLNIFILYLVTIPCFSRHKQTINYSK